MVKIWIVVYSESMIVLGMGGNALKSVKSSRIPFDTYVKIKEDIRTKFAKANIEVAYAYDIPGKVDFGDVDMYCSIPASSIYCNRVNITGNY